MGLDRPGLALGRGELFYISHTAKRGFRILVTVNWEMECRSEFWEIVNVCV